MGKTGKMSPKLKLGCNSCSKKSELDDLNFGDIKLSFPETQSSKIITLKGGMKPKPSKTKSLF